MKNSKNSHIFKSELCEFFTFDRFRIRAFRIRWNFFKRPLIFGLSFCTLCEFYFFMQILNIFFEKNLHILVVQIARIFLKKKFIQKYANFEEL